MTRFTMFSLTAIVTGVLTASHPARGDTRSVAAIELRNVSRTALAGVPITFGHVFTQGAVSSGEQLHGEVAGRVAQVDVKRRYDDGSLRFAVISLVLSEMSAGDSETLHLKSERPQPAVARPPLTAAELLKTEFDAEVFFRFPDGTSRAVSARRLLQRTAEKAKTWLRGPVATEWLLSAAPLSADGTPDEDLRVQFQVRAYAGGQARVSVVVENCADQWAGNIRYDVSVTVCGKEVFAARAVDHRRLSRWRKVFWSDGNESPVHIVHDLEAITRSGALPNYDRTLPIAELTPDTRRQLDLSSPTFEILGRGSLTAYMGTTGGRLEIAPYPTWTVQYLLTQTPEAKAVVLAHGDLAGAWPIHVRAEKAGRLMTIDERPKFWLDSRGKDRPQWKPDRHAPDAKQAKLEPDMAHQPSLAYVPYLATGDFYYLEEAYFWANYCLLSMWPEPRQDARGILAGQIRGDAWALRNIADAAWIAPDGDVEARYFEEKVRNNLAERTAKMYGPPEYNAIGAWGIRTVSDARIQNAANPNWMITAPWEEDYLLWSLHHLVELGYTEAAQPRDFLLRLRVGLLTNAPHYDPMLATPYRLVVGERVGKDVVFYEDWKKIGEENARLSKPDLPNYGNSYAYSARAAVICGIDGGFPKAREALDWLDAHLPNQRQVMADNPAWAIVPRKAAK